MISPESVVPTMEGPSPRRRDFGVSVLGVMRYPPCAPCGKTLRAREKPLAATNPQPTPRLRRRVESFMMAREEGVEKNQKEAIIQELETEKKEVV